MAVRASMAEVISRLRAMIGDPAGASQVWDDQTIQDYLDRWQGIARYAPLRPEPTYAPGGVVEYLDYYADRVAAKAIGAEGDVWGAGLQAIVPKSNTPETTGIKLTEEKAITATVGVEALTGGKAAIYLDYYEGQPTYVEEQQGD